MIITRTMDNVLAASSASVMNAALLPMTTIPNSSLPFGLAVILHGVVFTINNMTVGVSRFAAINAMMLLGGATLHTATSTAIGHSSSRGYSIILSGMAFLCFLYELQAFTYGKTRKDEADLADNDAPVASTGMLLILVTMTPTIVIPMTALAAIAIVGIALLIVLAPIL